MQSLLLQGLAVFALIIVVAPNCPETVPEQRTRTVPKETQEIRTKQCWRIYENYACTYTVPVWKTVEETYYETECCKGYVNVNGTCVPQCDDCGNGKCIKPHECVCMTGYERNLHNGQCDPICSLPCLNGVCVAPNVCECKPGYRRHSLHNTTCEPLCDMECVHGTCSSPNNCTCKPHYILEPILNGTREQCFPLCVHNCINRECFCACPSNYEPPSDDSSICRPKCREPCRNGYCNDPEECECYDGYKKIGPFECAPECLSECINATCTAPSTCTCQAGYTFKNGSSSECVEVCDGNDCRSQTELICKTGFIVSSDNKTCVPLCREPCVNANCTSLDSCECWDGYVKASKDPYICLPVCNPPCRNGACVKPEVCDPPDPGKPGLERNETCHSTSVSHTKQDSIANHIICIVLVTLFAGGFITALVLYLRQRKHHYRLSRSSDEHSLTESFYVGFKA